jgi:hypothetical protein
MGHVDEGVVAKSPFSWHGCITLIPAPIPVYIAVGICFTIGMGIEERSSLICPIGNSNIIPPRETAIVETLAQQHNICQRIVDCENGLFVLSAYVE